MLWINETVVENTHRNTRVSSASDRNLPLELAEPTLRYIKTDRSSVAKGGRSNGIAKEVPFFAPSTIRTSQGLAGRFAAFQESVLN